MSAPLRRAVRTTGQVGGSRWEVVRRPPPLSLRPYVRDLCGYSESTPGFCRRAELPAAQVVVIFEFGPPIRIIDPRTSESWRFSEGFVAGLDDGPTLSEHDGFQRGFQANLTPIGGRLFFGLPMSELAGRCVPMGDVLPRKHRDLARRLRDLPDWDERFDLFEHVLQETIEAAGAPHAIVSWAMRRILERGGALDMRGLSRELGYSQKHVISLFREHVGVPPKSVARLVRFDRLIQHLRSGGGGSWVDLALEFGYYDQSHLVRDVRHFTGQTPTETRVRLLDFTAGVDEGAQPAPIAATA
jgi:AraC-like DNA-binding protein